MKTSRKKTLIIIITSVIVIGIVGGLIIANGGKGQEGPKTVQVQKKTIVDKALAVGAIEPLNEIAVKSEISGVVKALFVEVGDYVRQGDPLLEVKPNPTPWERVETKRNLELANIEVNTKKRELERNASLKEKGLISDYDYEQLQKEYDQAILNEKKARERLELIDKGKVQIEDTKIESIIKSRIDGFVLEKSVNVGDPVVPLTSYQAGTELLKMANMNALLFKGTVDEIDVGKIKEEMKSELEIGALPGKNVSGHVTLISLKARKEDNTTVFPIEIAIDETDDATLRAGFSANANIIIAQRDSVLSLPERVITFRNDSAFVTISGEASVEVEDEKESVSFASLFSGFKSKQKSEPVEKYIETGLSDAINIEIVSGLEEGDVVLEKVNKKIK